MHFCGGRIGCSPERTPIVTAVRRRRSLRRSAAALVATLAVTAGTALLAQPAEAHPKPPSPGHHKVSGYVALGDSYASGEGLAPFAEGTGGPGECHRSASQSYPVRLADSRKRAFDGLTSVACSGAITADLVTTRPNTTRAPQLAALNRKTETVTLTIGGNDAGFSVIFGDCVYTVAPELAPVVPGSPGCATRGDLVVSTRIAALAGGKNAPVLPGVYPLPDALRAVAAVAPRAKIYVTGYPQIFGSKITNPLGCQVNDQAPLFVTADDAAWVRSKAKQLNTGIASAVKTARRAGVNAHYVDVAGVFRGHNLCDQKPTKKPKSPWLNGVVLTQVSPTDPPSFSQASFHPTARGQQAYASAVRHRAWR